MLNRLVRTLSGAALCCVLAGGCERPAATPPPAATPAATPAALPAPPKSTKVMPRIVSVTPDTINVVDGRAFRRSFLITYEIDNPERVEKALVSVYARGVGEMRRIDVPVVPRGSVDLEIDGDHIDLGPNVRFRAACPAGVTGWYTLGQEPLPPEERMSTALLIGGIGPEWIEQIQDISGSAVRIHIGGNGLTGDCKPEAQVNRRTVELRNAFFRDKHWEGLLLRSDIGDRAVAARYLEVKFIVHGPQIGLEAIKHIRFKEPE